MSTAADRLRENVVAVAVTLVIALGVTGLLVGIESFWLVFVIGFLFIIPLVALLFGSEEDRKAWWDWGDTWWDDWWDWWDPAESAKDESKETPSRSTSTALHRRQTHW